MKMDPGNSRVRLCDLTPGLRQGHGNPKKPKSRHSVWECSVNSASCASILEYAAMRSPQGTENKNNNKDKDGRGRPCIHGNPRKMLQTMGIAPGWILGCGFQRRRRILGCNFQRPPGVFVPSRTKTGPGLFESQQNPQIQQNSPDWIGAGGGMVPRGIRAKGRI